MQKIREKVKEQDFFGKPIQLTYKGDKEFNSSIGGCCSIILVIGALIIFCVDLREVLFNRKFKVASE